MRFLRLSLLQLSLVRIDGIIEMRKIDYWWRKAKRWEKEASKEKKRQKSVCVHVKIMQCYLNWTGRLPLIVTDRLLLIKVLLICGRNQCLCAQSMADNHSLTVVCKSDHLSLLQTVFEQMVQSRLCCNRALGDEKTEIGQQTGGNCHN